MAIFLRMRTIRPVRTSCWHVVMPHQYLCLFVVLMTLAQTSTGTVGAFQPSVWNPSTRRSVIHDFTRPNTNQHSTSHLYVIKDETGTLNDDNNTSNILQKSKFHHVAMEYCTGCRWMLKSFWLAQELLSTFGKNELDAVTVLPSFDNQGKFLIRLSELSMMTETESLASDITLWDRQQQGGFPAPKELKQLLRDSVNPDLYLGHSDTETRQSAHKGETIDHASVNPSGEATPASIQKVPLNPNFTPSPSVTIHYCTGCQWMLRAAYLGQELLTTFGDGELKSVTLVPSKPPEKGGRFVSGLE
jgi:selenoprotein W-related protein